MKPTNHFWIKAALVLVPVRPEARVWNQPFFVSVVTPEEHLASSAPPRLFCEFQPPGQPGCVPISATRMCFCSLSARVIRPALPLVFSFVESVASFHEAALNV